MNTIEAAFISAKEAALEYANRTLAEELECNEFQLPYRKSINPQVYMRHQQLIDEYLDNNFWNR